MSTTVTKPKSSESEYLEFERNSEFRHEYHQGEIRPMTGGTQSHNFITLNIYRAVADQLPESDYAIAVIDLRVKVSQNGLYTYPDLAIVKGKPQLEDKRKDTWLNPIVLVEVLSDSTEDYDRGEKFLRYQGISTFQEYLLAAQDRPEVDQFVGDESGTWQQYHYQGSLATVKLQSVPCSIPLAMIYKNIDFNSDS